MVRFLQSWIFLHKRAYFSKSQIYSFCVTRNKIPFYDINYTIGNIIKIKKKKNSSQHSVLFFTYKISDVRRRIAFRNNPILADKMSSLYSGFLCLLKKTQLLILLTFCARCNCVDLYYITEDHLVKKRCVLYTLMIPIKRRELLWKLHFNINIQE